MNALSLALRRELVATLDRLAQDKSVRVLVLTGAGKAFCAGLDLHELSGLRLDDNPPETDPVTADARFPGPVIGAINGVAVTGGLELALACDVLLASTRARFADTYARVGVMPFESTGHHAAFALALIRQLESPATGSIAGS